jgi:hypothetical protein
LAGVSPVRPTSLLQSISVSSTTSPVLSLAIALMPLHETFTRRIVTLAAVTSMQPFTSRSA